MSWEKRYSKKLRKLANKEAQWEVKKEILNREEKMKNEKNKNKTRISTSKKLILFLFINCTLIEIFTGYVTLRNFTLAEKIGISIDFSPLIALIGAVVGEVISFSIYSLKSTKENTVGGIVYQQAIQDYTDKDVQG